MIISLRETTSTNDYAKKLAVHNVDDFTTVVAHRQTGGQGRMGRSFYSPENEGIYMSVIVYPHMQPKMVSMVTIVAAMAVKKALEHVLAEIVDKSENVTLGIKWPNDIVVEGKKLCGILTEASMTEMDVKYLVVGIGINVNNEVFSEELQDKAISLKMLTGQNLDKKGIVEIVVKYFKQYYNQFVESENLGFMLDQYNASLVHNGVDVQIISGTDSYTGHCEGMDETGALLVRMASDNEVKKVISGEISVRGVYGYV